MPERIRELGDVLRAQLVGEAAAEEAPAGVRFEEVGPVTLKGVARPVTIFRAVRDEFPTPVPS
jgi:class 3 adenylate cyclase